ncbi:hypothetical protein D3C85_1089260 [compost metagenome]
MRDGPKLVLGEELLHRQLRQLGAQHRMTLRGQPDHVQRFSAKRDQHLATLRHGQRWPVFLQ